MIVYSVILFIAGAALILVGVLVYRGNTQLVHSYHQTRVKDKAAYGRAMGRVLAGMGAAPIAAGALGLFTRSAWPTVILLAGFAAAAVFLVRVQKKYNGGIF